MPMQAQYHIDPSAISLNAFFDTLAEGNIAPGRVILTEEKPARLAALKQAEITTLGALIDAVKTKKRASDLARRLGFSEQYVTILARQARSYLPSPVALDRLVGVEPEVVAALKAAGFKNTKQLFEAYHSAGSQEALAHSVGVAPEALDDVLAMTDLVRINGVGPVFAGLFLDAGVRNLKALAVGEPGDLLNRVNMAMQTAGYNGPSATLWDMEQCVASATQLVDA